jgi:hypothetical protein
MSSSSRVLANAASEGVGASLVPATKKETCRPPILAWCAQNTGRANATSATLEPSFRSTRLRFVLVLRFAY